MTDEHPPQPVIDPRAVPSPAICVLFIGSMWRSGSTLLDLMLGQLPGFVSVGELRQIWAKGCIDDRPCGCGAVFSECPFWTAVGEHAFGGWSKVDAHEMLRLRKSLDKAQVVPWFSSLRGPKDSGDTRAYLEALERLYGGIREVSGSAVVVDSSKSHGHALLLRRVPSIDLRLVHLVRDSRAVTYSKLRGLDKRKREGKISSDQEVNVRSWALRWLQYNAMLPRLLPKSAPRTRVRYEDLAAAPKDVLAETLLAAGFAAPPDALEFLQGDRLSVGENHIVYGNRMRSTRGEVVVRLDEEWKPSMRRRDRRTVTMLTYPLLKRYGYTRGRA